MSARRRRARPAEDALAYFLWWFLTGAPLDGVPRTNASWFRRGNLAYVDADGKIPGRWSFLSRAERAGIRLLATATTAGIVWSYMQRPDETVRAVAVTGWLIALVSLVVLGYKSAGLLLSWRHRRDWVWPLHVALHAKLGYPEPTPPRRYMHVPVDFDSGGSEPIIIMLPADFTGGPPEGGVPSGFGIAHPNAGNGAIIRQALTDKLPLHEKQFKWHLKGRDHYLEIKPIPKPPALVAITNPAVRALVEAQPESAPLLGLAALPLERRNKEGKLIELPPTWVAAGGRPVAVDFDAESPHGLIVGAPGAGKSNNVSIIAAQVLHNGGQVVVLDRRGHSLKWLRGLPGVTYLSAIQDIHTGLIDLWNEAQDRDQVIANWDDDADGEPEIGSRILIIVEEGNVLSGKLAKFWKRIREPEDDKESPADIALDELLYTGRRIRMNVLFVAQSGTVRAIGGVERRECFGGARILGRYTQNAWRMLVPEVMPIPRTTTHRGRLQVVIAAHSTETQMLYMSDPDKATRDSELRKWATSGITPPTLPRAVQTPSAPALVSEDPTAILTSSRVNDALSDGGPDGVSLTARHLALVADAEPADRLIGLREAVETGVITTTLGGTHQSRAHDQTFPKYKKKGGRSGQEHLYSANELAFWDRNRPRFKENL